MAKRTVDKREGAVLAEVDAGELAQHYARILGRQADRHISEVIRTCLLRIPRRLQPPDRQVAEALIERVLRLGEVGAPDLVGSPREIDGEIAGALGEAGADPRAVYRALRAMHGHTVLVERLSRQVWALRLSGLTDPSSRLHKALLAETPSLYSLPPSAPLIVGEVEQAPTKQDDGGRCELIAEVERLQRDLAAERELRTSEDRQRVAVDAELAELRRLLEEQGQAHSAVARQLAAEQTHCAEVEECLDATRSDAQAETDRLKLTIADFRQREEDARSAMAMARQELDELRQAQAADLARVRELVNENRIPEAITFFAARVLGAGVDDANRTIDRLTQTATHAPARSSTGPPVQPTILKVPSPGFRPGDALLVEPWHSSGKIGRNAPCPCGSGKKHKKCCGSASP